MYEGADKNKKGGVEIQRRCDKRIVLLFRIEGYITALISYVILQCCSISGEKHCLWAIKTDRTMESKMCALSYFLELWNDLNNCISSDVISEVTSVSCRFCSYYGRNEGQAMVFDYCWGENDNSANQCEGHKFPGRKIIIPQIMRKVDQLIVD